MFNKIYEIMQYTGYTKEDNYYEFVDANGNKTLMPVDKVIIVDDESGLLSIKLIATRKTIGYVHKS